MKRIVSTPLYSTKHSLFQIQVLDSTKSFLGLCCIHSIKEVVQDKEKQRLRDSLVGHLFSMCDCPKPKPLAQEGWGSGPEAHGFS